jgi:hypothetical protein
VKRAALKFSWSFRRRWFEKLGLQGIQSLIREPLDSGLVPIVAIKTVSNYLLSEVQALFYSNVPMDDIANIFFASLTIVDTFAFTVPLNLHLYYIPVASLKHKIKICPQIYF